MALKIPPKQGRRWDLVALGEVMLRLDPGEGRIHTARTFRAWEGGGEYNVARGLKRCFGLDTALVSTAGVLPDDSLRILPSGCVAAASSESIVRSYSGYARSLAPAGFICFGSALELQRADPQDFVDAGR